MHKTYSIDLALLVQIPDVLTAICDVFAESFTQRRPHVVIPSGQNYDVSFQFSTIRKHQGLIGETFDAVWTLLYFDLAVDDELAGTNIDVVASTSSDVLSIDARTVAAVVNLKTHFFEAIQASPLGFFYSLSQFQRSRQIVRELVDSGRLRRHPQLEGRVRRTYPRGA